MPFVKTPGFVDPQDDEQLWRYMDLPKYLNMLTTNQFRFTRSDLLGDSFEGSTTMPTKIEMDEFIKTMFPDGDEAETIRSQMVKSEVDISNFSRTHMYIHSWHVNDGESEAMWKIYSKEFGIAIVSSSED